MTTAWHQQYRQLVARGIRNPDPQVYFFKDMKKFIQAITQSGNLFIMGWDANAAHDSDEILSFMEETDQVDFFSDFFTTRPATHCNGSKQIDLLTGSVHLLTFFQNAFIVDPNESEGDHSIFGGDLNLGALIQRDSLREIDPTHQQARILASTDVKATKKFLADLQKKQDGHNVSNRMRQLFNRCAQTNRCSTQDEREFQKICKQMNKNAQQAESKCKVVGKWSWSNMLASAGQAMQIAKRELKELVQGATPGTCHDDRESAIARAKHNVTQATEIRDAILARADDLRETDLELRAEAEAK
jgi:hypothetical protein